MVSFLTDRNQFVHINERWSFTRIINRSIVQGSGIGPTLFVICIMDLKPVGSTNPITKYADDASLLVPEKNDADLEREFVNVTKWANDNKLMVNMAKTKEIVFHWPNARNYLPPAELPGIERVMFAKMLGVWLQNDLGFRTHIDYIMHICNQHIYLLTQLKRQVLPIADMQKVFNAIILF